MKLYMGKPIYYTPGVLTGETRFERLGKSVTVIPFYVKDAISPFQFKIKESGEVYKERNEAFVMARALLKKMVKKENVNNTNF